MFVLTSYNDQKTQIILPIVRRDNTQKGMNDCAEATRTFAREKDTNPQPQNTRSDPADRIRCFRKGIGSTRMDTKEQDAARSSEFYRKSLKFLLQCVLAQLYGEKISIKELNADELNKEKRFPGRQHFVKAVLDALDMDDKKILTLRNRAGRIVGLLSSAGPIPVVENILLLPELQINETKDLAAILHDLPTQDKEVLAYWLKNNVESSSLLYADIKDILETQEKIGTSYDFSKISAIMDVASTTYKAASFPVLKEHGEAVLCDRITVVPIRDNKTPFGYNTKPLCFEADGLYYAFLSPLTVETIAATTVVDFSIEKIAIPEGSNDQSAPRELRVPVDMEDNRLISVTIRCELKNKSLRQIVRRTYSGGEIRYVKNFPSLSIYGPVPLHGWIARRDIDIGDYPSPLKSGSVENITLNDIVFEKVEIADESKVIRNRLDFKETTDKYGLYCGPIPLWLAVRTATGDILGGLPLRVVPDSVQADWKNMPNFVHTEKPAGRLIVAADIGSSRSAILFHRSSDNDNENNEIFIDNGQPLGIPVTTSGSTDVDVNFGMMIFQPEKQLGKVEGKTPVGILTTDVFQNEDKDEVALFRSGKLILLDPKSIADAGTREILSDIKVGNDQKAQKAMYLLAKSLLTLIIDRAIHLQCKTVELRLSYLVERYSSFQTAWNDAIEKYGEHWPDIKVELKMYLPESLAIANKLKKENELNTMSGAAIIDIGDFTTDIALFIKKADNTIALKDSFSVQFAGRQIILQPIWDYLLFSGAKVVNLYNPDMMKSSECQQAVSRLEAAREKQKKEKKRKQLGDDVRRDLLCLMSNFNTQKIPPALRNLFDICYLTEIVILKRILRNEPEGGGAFDIHFYGGGRFLIKEAKKEIEAKDEDFDWATTLGRKCVTNTTGEGKTLALGLLRDIHDDLQDDAKGKENQAKKYNSDGGKVSHHTAAPSREELEKAYIRFLQNAQALKEWRVLDVNDNKVSTGKLFNIKKPSKNSDGVIDNDSLFREIYDGALEFAMAGSIADIEIIKTLFAYKMAYESAVAFYSKAKS